MGDACDAKRPKAGVGGKASWVEDGAKRPTTGHYRDVVVICIYVDYVYAHVYDEELLAGLWCGERVCTYVEISARIEYLGVEF